jgi:hypothetical protein
MISGRAKGKSGRTMIILGLSHANLERLKAGKPIAMTPMTHPVLPPDIEFYIFAGETEEAMTQMLQDGGIDLRGPEGQGKA